MSDGTYMGVREAAEMLEVHENTIRNWVRDGILTDARVPGTRYTRLIRDEVDAIEFNRATEAVTAAQEALERASERLAAAVRRAEEKLASR